MIEKDLFRYERKFIINSYLINNKEDLESFLSVRLIEVFNQRRINSIYYDTKNYQFAIDNINGISNRQKIRIRYYGNLEKFDLPRLEIKSKMGVVGTKEIFELNKDTLYKESFSLNQVYKLDLVNRKALYFLVSLQPKVIITYQRKYFLSSCEKFRFTLDHDIGFKNFNINSFNKNLNEENLYFFNKRILELKYDFKNELFVNNICKNFPLRSSSFSKYITALKYLGWEG